MSHTVEIIIKRDGTMTSHVEGIVGPSCAEKTQWVARLGRLVKGEETEAYHAHVDSYVSEEEKNEVKSEW
jgi:uridine kinase